MTPHIQTISGEMIPLASPEPHHIRLPEIALALSRIPRFNGHTLQPWSVAQHSLLVLHLMPDTATPTERLAALLHDAHEAYIGDITSPVAAAIRGQRDACPIDGLKTLFNVAIAGALAFDPALFHHPAIKRADAYALAIEHKILMATPAKPWPDLLPPPDDAPDLTMQSPEGARGDFLEAAALLILQRQGINAVSVEMRNAA
jgi:hypothetical protein